MSPGRSTLITSAPRSAKTMLQYGPANTLVRSSIRMCDSGDDKLMVDGLAIG